MEVRKASSFAKATADKTTGRPVRPIGSFRDLPQKAVPGSNRENNAPVGKVILKINGDKRELAIE
jgi:hypothetical protein